jgi:hypothetical protein
MTTDDERYLLCRVGRYPVAVRARAILRVWQRDLATTDASYVGEPIDLRILLSGASAEPGTGIAFETPDAVNVLIVDRVSGMATIAEAEFLALPLVFGYARSLFDAACRRVVEGGHPLRLRHRPSLPASHAAD